MDGINFTQSLKVPSALNNNFYQQLLSQETGTSYYRIKLLEYNGSLNYSPVISIRTNCAGKDLITVYPNPVSLKLYVKIFSTYRGQGYLVIKSAIGEQIAKEKIQIATNNSLTEMNFANYIPGVYMVYFTDDKGEKISETKKGIKN